MVSYYFRPILTEGEGLPLAGGPFFFARAQVLTRAGDAGIIDATDLPDEWRRRLTRPRPLLARFGQRVPLPLVMGILNITPDSFSSDGHHGDAAAAVTAALAMHAAGASIIDIGAESTRPGAAEVSAGEELARLAPLWPALGQAGLPVSIDTRNSRVMAAALDAGAIIVNDVSALTHDPEAAALVAQRGCPVVLMHHQGTPATMQAAPSYDDVLLDVYDWLEQRIAAAIAAGIDRDMIIADPGIGFGKSLAHNRALLKGLGLLHGLGVPILLGASRKALISHICGPLPVADRLPGSLAMALAGANAGVQLLRVHDVAETMQALRLWAACRPGLA